MGISQKTYNWGMYPVIDAEIVSSGDYAEITNLLTTNSPLIARGNGRCYGDSALNKSIFSTLELNKILVFDRQAGILTCQSGVLFSELLPIILRQGFFFYVTPGTQFITVGGAIAADVHGKNHHKDGCFSSCLLSFDLLREDGTIVSCSRDNNQDLFWQTCGGMGLTGIILQASFKLRKIETAYIRQTTKKASNLEEIMALFAANEDAAYTVAWIDCLASGRQIGKSVLMAGEHATRSELPVPFRNNPLMTARQKKLAIPFSLPSGILNRYSVRLFNSIYYSSRKDTPAPTIVHYHPFFYPLDGVLHWNRIYGRKGFTQYQFVLPEESSREGLQIILQKIADSGEGSFLAVLKLFGAEREYPAMSFPRRGYTLALDFVVSPNVLRLLNELDAIVLDYDGRLYLAKDARMAADFFHKTYHDKVAHSHLFQSMQSKRLGL